MRIISLVPSQTELLFHLGLADEVVGITKFCIHPEVLCESKVKIGGTKNFHFDVIDQLQPDLIIGNKEENYKEGIEQLQEKYRLWISDIYTLEDALSMICTVGDLTNRTNKATLLIEQIEEAFRKIKPVSKKSVAYFIWKKPFMAAGNHTFIDNMLQWCGFNNVFSSHARYPEVTEAMIAKANPEYIFLSSEPYPFREKHIEEFRSICPDATIMVVDGEMFSWYGSRLLISSGYFRSLISKLTGQ